MFCEQEYLLSDNIITIVTILVCALTVTKYNLPYQLFWKCCLQYQVVESNIGIKRKLLVRSTRNKVDIWWAHFSSDYSNFIEKNAQKTWKFMICMLIVQKTW